MTDTPTIVYTKTDEAPALATYSFLPIATAFAKTAGVALELRDISLAGRILAQFNDRLAPEHRVSDALAELGEMTQSPEANIIKLPNISASVPQLEAAIRELQAKGFAIPDYPVAPSTDEEREIAARYQRVKGSAVNPVLREGNSDRRAPKAVKEYARSNPHSMGAWESTSASHVATMEGGDFRSNERSVTMNEATVARIEHVAADGEVTTLKEGIALEAGEIVDATTMQLVALRSFLTEQVQDARDKGVLFSLHMKATMMKVSDPIIFGHGVRVFFKDVFERFGDVFDRIGVNVNNGLGDLLSKVEGLPASERDPILKAIDDVYASGPSLAMVDSDRGITNLHVPSDVIIDASMPAMIRTSGRMWNAQGQAEDAKAVIPDSSYAGVYREVIEFCKRNGAFDPTTMGSVPNVGLMAKKAEEYGSHDKTFEIDRAGTVRVVLESGEAVLSHDVAAGDIWRMCQVKDAPVRDWVQLAVRRARATGAATVFWLDDARAHDAELITKVRRYLTETDTDGLEISIRSPIEATKFTLDRIKEGLDTISVTGNVLRDYLTDLFPILEVGTSAKMLSIVPLMRGGGLFETGAGGSAPKHVQQFEKEGHLRWDSLGEFLALAVSLEHLAETHDLPKARLLGKTLDIGTTEYLMQNKSPSRKVGELDNRGSHFYLAMYWARALASQSEDAELAARFKALADALTNAEATIVAELNGAQGDPESLGGYYAPDDAKAASAMRPSATLNEIIDGF